MCQSHHSYQPHLQQHRRLYLVKKKALVSSLPTIKLWVDKVSNEPMLLAAKDPDIFLRSFNKALGSVVCPLDYFFNKFM